jgi:hypothetical protein
MNVCFEVSVDEIRPGDTVLLVANDNSGLFTEVTETDVASIAFCSMQKISLPVRLFLLERKPPEGMDLMRATECVPAKLDRALSAIRGLHHDRHNTDEELVVSDLREAMDAIGAALTGVTQPTAAEPLDRPCLTYGAGDDPDDATKEVRK